MTILTRNGRKPFDISMPRIIIRSALSMLVLLALLAGMRAPAASLAATLENVRAVAAEAKFQAPSFSPDGKKLAAGGPGFNGIYLLDASLSSAPPTELASGPLSGFHFLWLPDSSGIVFRSFAGLTPVCCSSSLAGGAVVTHGPIKESTLPMRCRDTVFYLDSLGEPHIIQGSLAPEALVFASVAGDIVYLNEGTRSRRISPAGDRFMLPQLSPNGNYVVFEGLTTGIWIYSRANGALVNLGKGQNPVWTPDSSFVYYDVEEDDGERIVASDLWRAGPDGVKKEQLTATQDVMEMRPAISPEGRQAAFEANGQVRIAEIKEKP